MEAVFTPVGVVRTGYADRKDCPKQYSEDAALARIEIRAGLERAAADLAPGMEIWLLTWLHQGDVSVQAVHPRGDASRPLTGVFATRSPDRPVPIGMHRCRVAAVDGLTVAVTALEVLDGTPVLDIKPVIAADDRPLLPELDDLVRVGRLGWERGLFSGREGNISVRTGETGLLVTASGVCKGRLSPADVCRVDMATGLGRPGERPTSELPAHLAIYREQEQARAIVHTHPPHVLALDRLFEDPREMLNLSLYETDTYREKFGVVPALPPGGEKLGQSVGKTAANRQALLMRRHGLICWGKTLEEALCLSEELENMARIRWMLLAGEA